MTDSKLEIPAGFADYYENNIKPQAEIFEKKRLQYLNKFWWRLPILLMATAALIYLYVQKSHYLAGDNGNVATFVLGGLGLWLMWPIRQYKSDIKKDVFPIVFNFFGKDLSYTFNTDFDSSIFSDFGIIPSHDDEHNQDEIKAKYKDVALRIVQCKFSSGSGKNRRVVFKGPLMLLSMNKKFNCCTIVRKDFGMFGNLLQSSHKLQPVHLEDPVFEKIFNVYSNDQVQARYLLTTTFMENLLKLSNLFCGKTIEASFYNFQLLLKIDSSKEWFEPDSIFKPCNFADDAKMILQKMQLIFNIIDILKLDQNTGF